MAKRANSTSEPTFVRRLRQHFGTDPARMGIVEQSVESYERPNLHLALEEILAELDDQPQLTGLVTEHDHYAPSLARLSRAITARYFSTAPVSYIDVALADNRRLACVKEGLYLFTIQKRPLALLISPQESWRPNTGINVEVMAKEQALAEQFLRQHMKETRHGKAFRGTVFFLERRLLSRDSGSIPSAATDSAG